MSTAKNEAYPASILGATLRFKGELHADEDLLIKGQIEGSIGNSKRLTVGREARVKASIRGHIVAIEGSVEGDVTAETSVALLAGCRLKGSVHAPSIGIAAGAEVDGKVRMDADHATPVLTPTDAAHEIPHP